MFALVALSGLIISYFVYDSYQNMLIQKAAERLADFDDL